MSPSSYHLSHTQHESRDMRSMMHEGSILDRLLSIGEAPQADSSSYICGSNGLVKDHMKMLFVKQYAEWYAKGERAPLLNGQSQRLQLLLRYRQPDITVRGRIGRALLVSMQMFSRDLGRRLSQLEDGGRVVFRIALRWSLGDLEGEGLEEANLAF